MSSRALAVFLILSTSTGALALASAMTGCSEDEPRANGDGGTDGSMEANRPAAPETDARPKTCREQCEEAHPAGLPRDEAVDSCWDTHCRNPCIEGVVDDGGIAEGGAAPDGGTCASPVVTISLACDECTNTFCCAAWDECFQEPECAALNACYQDCTE